MCTLKNVFHGSSARRRTSENRTERERKNNVGKCGNRNVLVREATVMGFQIPAHIKASNCAKYPTNNSTTVARTNTIIVPDEPCHVHLKKVCSHVPKKGSGYSQEADTTRSRRTCPSAAQV
jgi:hypothetical protein